MDLVIVEDHRLVGELLVRALEGLCASAVLLDSAQESESWVGRHSADVFLLDIDLAGHDGLALVPAIRARSPHAKIIAMTGQDVEAGRVAATEAGTDGFYPKATSLSGLKGMLTDLSIADKAPTGRARDLSLRSDLDARIILTRHRLDLVELLASGLTIKEIAAKLRLSEDTVAETLANVRARLMARSNAALVYEAVKHGFLLPSRSATKRLD